MPLMILTKSWTIEDRLKEVVAPMTPTARQVVDIPMQRRALKKKKNLNQTWNASMKKMKNKGMKKDYKSVTSSYYSICRFVSILYIFYSTGLWTKNHRNLLQISHEGRYGSHEKESIHYWTNVWNWIYECTI